MKGNLFPIIACSIFTLMIYFVIEWLHVNRAIPYEYLTTDVNAIHESPKYLGFLSQLGMPFWFGTSAILLFSGFLIKKWKASNSQQYFILNAGFLTIFLGLDDLYLLHDELSHRGIQEQYFYIFYLVWLSITIYKFRNNIIKTQFTSLFVALGAFALSIVIDQLPFEATLYEDLAKFFGILLWSSYWIYTSTNYIINQYHNNTKQ